MGREKKRSGPPKNPNPNKIKLTKTPSKKGKEIFLKRKETEHSNSKFQKKKEDKISKIIFRFGNQNDKKMKERMISFFLIRVQLQTARPTEPENKDKETRYSQIRFQKHKYKKKGNSEIHDGRRRADRG